jgi:hypothetical protein
MSHRDEYGDFKAWKKAVNLSLGIDDEELADLTSKDYPEFPDDSVPMAGELKGLPSPDDEVLPFDSVSALDK